MQTRGLIVLLLAKAAGSNPNTDSDDNPGYTFNDPDIIGGIHKRYLYMSDFEKRVIFRIQLLNTICILFQVLLYNY